MVLNVLLSHFMAYQCKIFLIFFSIIIIIIIIIIGHIAHVHQTYLTGWYRNMMGVTVHFDKYVVIGYTRQMDV